MDFRTSLDYNVESGLEDIQGEIIELEDEIARKSFGKNELAIFVVFMCRDPNIKFKQRIRYSNRDNVLYMDLMLHLPEMEAASHDERKRIVGKKMINEIPEIMSQYKFSDFDSEEFIEDLRDWLIRKDWIDV